MRVAGADDRGGRLTIESRLDTAQPVVTNAVRHTDVQVTGDGRNTVTATATDRAGNDDIIEPGRSRVVFFVRCECDITTQKPSLRRIFFVSFTSCVCAISLFGR